MSQAAHEVEAQAQIQVLMEDIGPVPRRSSIVKRPIHADSDFEDFSDDDDRPSAFTRLPEEIIQQILKVADPNAFASLILLNSKWRHASQQAQLYAAQLMRCPSYSASHNKEPDGKQDNLAELRKLFAREVKRNLFDAYLRPNHTMIKIVSNSISSSSCPGGDGIAFTPSPMGHYLLAYNSSRIHIIDLRGPTISVERELKILRRPVATCIRDDGSLLAVLLTEMQVELYDLTSTPPKHTQSFILDHSPRAIALSPCGTVLAAAYEGGIEVQALNPGALATDRRSVKCDAVDALAFSFDGTQILGTTVHSAQPNTVILTAPYYDPGAQMSSDDISALWTTSILFPNTSRDCSHAVLLQESSHEEAYWTFTYDRSFETFRAVRIDDLRNGTTYFTGPISKTPSKLLPCTLPSASSRSELVSAGFQGKEIWLYGVPEDLEAVPEVSSLEVDTTLEGVVRSASGSSMRSRPRTHDAGESRVPQWQLLCDKYRNTFRGGFKAAELSGVSMVKWVASFGDSSLKERLVIAAKGATPAKPMNMDDDGMDFEDGGRLTLVDFNYGVEDGQVNEITIEVGLKEPEVLEEERRDLETEVAIVRRRTVAQRRGNRSAVMRAATTAARPTAGRTTEEDENEGEDSDPLLPRRMTAVPTRPRPASTATEETDTQAVLEEVEALDAPYSHTGPRSITTLRRAATAAANHRRHHPTITSGAPIEYRRADGRAEHPHESDADNWVPPPPPYQKDDPGATPAFLRHSMAPVLAAAQPHPRNDNIPPVPPIPPMPTSLPPVPPLPQARRSFISERAAGLALTPSQSRASRRQTYMPDRRQTMHAQASAHHRLSSYPAMPTTQASVGSAASVSSQYNEDDIYNVSPPDSPQPQDSVSQAQSTSETGETSNRPPLHVRQVSNPSPALSEVATTPYTGTQRVIPLVPRIQTSVSSPYSELTKPSVSSEPPRTVPEPSSASSTWNPHTSGATGAVPVVQSQAWPIKPGSVAAARAAMGPRSAPPTSMTINDMITRSQHPVPVRDIDPSFDNGRESSLARRLSNGFHLPRNRTATRSQSRTGERSRPLSVAEQAPRAGTAQSMYQLHRQDASRPEARETHGPPQPQEPRIHSPPMSHSFQAYQGNFTNASETHTHSLPDQPLIISTPSGVQGAYDSYTDRPQDERAETPIVAPVARHAHVSQLPGLMRPTGPAERLENIYAGQLNPNPLAALTVAPSDLASRVSSLNRRPSRAERSAARNIADAKKKGWRPGRSKSKKGKKSRRREPDFDIMSQSAWTDVSMATAGRHQRTIYNFPNAQMPPKTERDKKCVVM